MRVENEAAPETVPNLGTALALLRVARGLTQAELSRLSGIKRSSISGYEQDKVTPDASILQKLLLTMSYSWSALDRAAAFLESLRIEDVAGHRPAQRTHREETIQALSEAFGRSSTRLGRALLTLAVDAVDEHLIEVSTCRSPLPSDRELAPALFAKIEHHTPEERRSLVSTEPDLRSWALAEYLCMKSENLFAAEPAAAIQLAELAVFVAERCPGSPGWRVRLVAFTFAHLGNAWRVQGELRKAEDAFARVGAWWSVGAEADPAGLLDETRVLALMAALRTAQRRYPDSMTLIDRALACSPETLLRCRLLVSKAKALEESGAPDAAISCLEEAAPLVERDQDPRLYLCIRHNMVCLLGYGGRAEEAERLLPEAVDLSRTLGTVLDQARLLWVAGKIRAELGDSERAAALYLQARGVFADRRISFDTAHISLELAVLYAEQERMEEVKTIARSLVPIFQANDLPRETLSALTLFRQAAEKEEVTAEFARRIATYVHRARFNPEMRFG